MPRNATFKVQARGREFCRQVGIKTVSQGLGAGHRELEGLGMGWGSFWHCCMESCVPVRAGDRGRLDVSLRSVRKVEHLTRTVRWPQTPLGLRKTQTERKDEVTQKETALEVKAVAAQCCWPRSVPVPPPRPGRGAQSPAQEPRLCPGALQGVRGSPPAAGSYCW